jgi:quercetin dioxygenase-like cupin family protein
MAGTWFVGVLGAVAIGGAALAVVVGVANLLHRVVFPAAPPDPATFPREGDVFRSVAEGVTQEVVGVRNGWVLLRSRVAPGAQGPPMHVHRSFAETFTVAAGTLHVELPDGVIQLRAGESYTVEAGVAHRPFNPTDREVVIGGDTPVMPQAFAATLVQIYHFLDAAQGRVGPALGLRIAALDPSGDTRLAGVPPWMPTLVDWLVLPFARLAGYANYYPELALHPPAPPVAPALAGRGERS